MAKKLHMLLIDDDPVMLQLFGGQFAQKGFEMMYAHEGAEGWELARRLKPTIILCDYRMPNMDGMETAQHLKEDSEETKKVPLVMLTSEDFSPEAQKMLKEIGVDDYVHKGLPFKEILDRVKSVLKKYQIEYEEPKEAY